MLGWFRHWLRNWFLGPWERVNRAAEQERAAHPGFDARVPLVLVACAFILVFQEYVGDRPFFKAHVERIGDGEWYELAAFAWWSGAKVVGYLVVPALFVKVVLRGRLADYGLRVSGIARHLWIYGAILGAILPIVWIASYTKAFQETYPFYKLAARSWTDYVAWELMYGASFVALEFFFRGFLLFALERAIGAYAIFVMVVPYCMIHFHKPPAEVCGAIFAGIVLGTLSMATRSIWYGVMIHVSVAWTMDGLAIAHVYGWPGRGGYFVP